MDNVIQLKNINKNYEDFSLDSISLNIPKGYITGIIGENGAGKTTLLKIIMQLINSDSGEIYINEKIINPRNYKLFNFIYIIYDSINLNEKLTIEQYGKVYGRLYCNWDNNYYYKLINDFKLPKNKQINTFSKGMKVKVNFALALATKPKILLLDEATSGLDPLIRDDILNLLLEFVQDETNTVLISSHIISDLDKIADKLIFLHKGKVFLDEMTYNIDKQYAIAYCDINELNTYLPYCLAYKEYKFEFKLLIDKKENLLVDFPDMKVEKAYFEDIIKIIGKGIVL
ncbi:ABC transporter ATP-binding protein [Miniphocaeibacter halophilus]|uniref:ABC transporter ATP-binding protein n=1 Tax=Miniphocaeibacter halophilus TaxID=2931922 RepID=A0AC61N1N3_9FIRM|nr:ABC transporter ATP-binding protein [Miniphocaeibacter halophilus]QQK09001.1 ABC transporter ATP-binding protein [Miniphocaeibacter halophilus]